MTVGLLLDIENGETPMSQQTLIELSRWQWARSGVSEQTMVSSASGMGPDGTFA